MPRVRTAPDPDRAFLRAVRARLDALDELTEPTADEATERARLRVIWAHAQSTPAMPAPRRSSVRRSK